MPISHNLVLQRDRKQYTPMLAAETCFELTFASTPETAAMDGGYLFTAQRTGFCLVCPAFRESCATCLFSACRHKSREIAKCGLDLQDLWLEHLKRLSLTTTPASRKVSRRDLQPRLKRRCNDSQPLRVVSLSYQPAVHSYLLHRVVPSAFSAIEHCMTRLKQNLCSFLACCITRILKRLSSLT
jgi:hypothetical protein